jgi:hypothetical protein
LQLLQIVLDLLVLVGDLLNSLLQVPLTSLLLSEDCLALRPLSAAACALKSRLRAASASRCARAVSRAIAVTNPAKPRRDMVPSQVYLALVYQVQTPFYHNRSVGAWIGPRRDSHRLSAIMLNNRHSETGGSHLSARGPRAGSSALRARREHRGHRKCGNG